MTDGQIKAFETKAAGFERPIQLPRDEEERRRWQMANRAWWEAAPMRYDWRAELNESTTMMTMGKRRKSRMKPARA